MHTPTPASSSSPSSSSSSTSASDATSGCCCGPDCCGGAKAAAPSADSVRDAVREGYASIAQAGTWNAARTDGAEAPAAGSCCSGGGCCGPTTFTPDQLAAAIGYSRDELAVAPEGANMGLSCGNPTALASLRPGDRKSVV